MLKFFAAETEEDPQIDIAMKTTMLVRSTINSRKVIEDIQSKKKTFLRKKTNKKTTKIDDISGIRPIYIAEPTNEEVKSLFKKILNKMQNDF